ncbi:MAG: hypothetical protein NC432_13515 [Roseburia sp.]|nr:hypothetical protein [Roseburia sp.]MCM1098775.1 hypothetical protein [Ruminococcus flavefaciens]
MEKITLVDFINFVMTHPVGCIIGAIVLILIAIIIARVPGGGDPDPCSGGCIGVAGCM